jgi:prevent-host-death family protein
VKTASAAKIAAQFDDYLEFSRQQPVLVTRNGKPVAVLMAVQDKADAEQLASGRSRSLRSVLEEGHEIRRPLMGVFDPPSESVQRRRFSARRRSASLPGRFGLPAAARATAQGKQPSPR